MKSIFRFSEAFNIGLHAMVFIAVAAPEKLQIKDLTEVMSVSQHHLAKVLQRLCKAGVISSVKGPNGGFYIDSDVKNISLIEIYEIIEGKFSIGNCMFEKKICRKKVCSIGNLLETAGKSVYAYFTKTKLSDLI